MERPILFNTAMVEAILEGRKTQTRRLVKHSLLQNAEEDEDGLWIEDENGDYYQAEEFAPIHPGDKLYVRETWKRALQKEDTWKKPAVYLFKAGKQPDYKTFCKIDDFWHPSIHMPKAAARIWLKVKDVRCERLQEITNDGAHAEGALELDFTWLVDNDDKDIREFFGHHIWDQTVKKQSDKWDANPWVWVIEFERIEGQTP